MYTIEGKYTTALVTNDATEAECVSQIHRMVNHPAFTKPIVIMPDAHAGKGAVIGFTMQLGEFAIPNVVGVDIGCGVACYFLGKFLSGGNRQDLDDQIRSAVPFGFSIHEKQAVFVQDSVREVCVRLGLDTSRVERSMGTLGGGNHFIEFGIGLEENIYLLIHSGSRNFGKQVCEYWQRIADQKNPCSHGLSYLSDPHDVSGYLKNLDVARMYAKNNRVAIAVAVTNILNAKLQLVVDSVHNEIDELEMIRKGATVANADKFLIIPLNMRDGSLLCKGRGNEEWNRSAPHGAGRRLSRSAAKQELTVEDFKTDMQGIFSTNIGKACLDEAPRAYKDAQEIIDLIDPTVTFVDRIKPIHSMKA